MKKLKWTPTKPSEPGFYKFKDESSGDKCWMRVFFNADFLMIGPASEDDSHALPVDFIRNGEWRGPFPKVEEDV